MPEPVIPSVPVSSSQHRADGAVYLMVGMTMITGYLALAATAIVPSLIVLVPVVLMGVGRSAERLDNRWPAYRLLTTGLTVVFTLILPVLFAVFGLIGGVLWLIVFIQAHKYFHRRVRRDYFHILLMSFFMIATACSQSPGESIALVIFLALVSGVAACILLQVREELILTPDHVFAALRMPDQPRHRDERPARILFRWVFLINVGILGLVVLVFLIIPRMEAGLIHREQSEIAVTQQTSEVDVSYSGSILEDTGIVMRVEFPEEPGKRYEGPLYWRITAYNNYGNSRWQWAPLLGPITDMAPQEKPEAYSGNILSRAPLGSPRTVLQRIFLDKVPPNGLPALPLPWQVESSQVRVVWGAANDYTILPASSPGGMQYEVLSEIIEYDPAFLTDVRSDYSWALGSANMSLLTRHDLNTQAIRLAYDLTEGIESPYLKVQAIKEYLESDLFEYSLTIPEHTWVSPISQFILLTRTGHCELFASAMALMCRSIGIPARVVSGYLGGEWDEEEEACIVRQSMSHLWVEVYLLDIGWVPFDPSPRGDADYQSLSWVHMALTQVSLHARLFWLSSVIGYRGSLPWASLSGLFGTFFSRWTVFSDLTELGAGSRETLKIGRVLLVLIPVALLALALLFRRPGARRVRTTSLKLTGDQARARRLYVLLRGRLTALGYTLQGLTPGELVLEVGKPDSPLSSNGAEIVRRVVEAYSEARFGQAALSRTQYVRLVAEVRAQVRRRRGRSS